MNLVKVGLSYVNPDHVSAISPSGMITCVILLRGGASMGVALSADEAYAALSGESPEPAAVELVKPEFGSLEDDEAFERGAGLGN